MLIVVEDGGGLANRLFVFSNIIVTGLATGHRVANPAFRQWANSFEGTAGDYFAVFPRRSRPLFRGLFAARVAASLSFRLARLTTAKPRLGPLRTIVLEWPEQCDLNDPQNVTDLRRIRVALLKGWLFRNPAGIEAHASLLRSFFRPIEGVRLEAERVVESARACGDLVVGVHVRQKDFRDYMNGRFFYPFTAYADLMRSLESMLAPRRPVFLVCSDEVQDSTQTEGMRMFYSRMGPVHDLWALSRCDLLMGPPSTFSAWAGFLGEVRKWVIWSDQARPNEEEFAVPRPVAEGEGWCERTG